MAKQTLYVRVEHNEIVDFHVTVFVRVKGNIVKEIILFADQEEAQAYNDQCVAEAKKENWVEGSVTLQTLTFDGVTFLPEVK